MSIFSIFFKKFKYIILQAYGYFVFGKRVGVMGFFGVGNAENIFIGDDCGINADVFILGHSNITIGNNVVLSVGVKILDAGLDLNCYASTEKPQHISSFVIIEDGVWVGAGAIILPGVTIGTKSVVGAGSVVTSDVPPFTVVAGNPARPIGRTDA